MPQTPPAEGERRAVGGLRPQYLLSAARTVDCLRNGRRDWVRVADPEAGRVDDFQVADPSSVNAYQFKWSAHQGNFSFSDLKHSEDGKPSLIAQLLDGWRKLRQLHSTKRVRVHLATNDLASTNPNAPIPTGSPPPTPCHFSAFIEQAWKLAGEDPSPSWTCPEPWRPAWETLQKESGATDAVEWLQFVRNCQLEFGTALPSNAPYPDVRYLEDVEAVAAFLLARVAAPARPGVEAADAAAALMSLPSPPVKRIVS